MFNVLQGLEFFVVEKYIKTALKHGRKGLIQKENKQNKIQCKLTVYDICLFCVFSFTSS